MPHLFSRARRAVVLAAAAVAAGALAPGAPPAGAQPAGAGPRPPNIVWISAEDLSPRLGAYGDRLARTPTVDRLAREGVRYTRAFATSPVCAPSRSGIITGMYPTSIGTHHMRTTEDRAPGLPGPYLAVPPPHVKAFTEYLRAAGYHTTNDAKTDYQFAPISNPRQPLTAWDSSGPGAHWRQRADSAQPFFAVFNLGVTHESRVWADAPQNRGTPLVTDPAAVTVPPYYPDARPVREDLARHYDNIAEMDRQASAILRQLEADGLADNTVVFFWSDHGDGLPRAKRWLYDSGLRVPLVVWAPPRLRASLGIAPGSTDGGLASLHDLGPTVLALAGVPVPRHMQGRVLLGPSRDPAPAYAFGARDRMDVVYDMVRSARDHRWKYVRNYYPESPYVELLPYLNRNATMQELLRQRAAGTLTGPAALWLRDGRPPEELYDTDGDPHEIRNLAADRAHRATLGRMRGALDEWMWRVGDLGAVPELELVRRMWPGGVQPVTAAPLVLGRRSVDSDLKHASEITSAEPLEIELVSTTHGASITYTTDDGPRARWRLYTGPLLVRETTALRARAVRYGYKDSDEARARVVITRIVRAGQ